MRQLPGWTGCVAAQPATGSLGSSVQALPSLQSRAVPAVQAPAWQVSRPLHTVESSQAVPFGRLDQALWDTDDWQDWHALVGLMSPFL